MSWVGGRPLARNEGSDHGAGGIADTVSVFHGPYVSHGFDTMRDAALFWHVFRHWDTLRCGDKLPAKAKLDPVEIGPNVLPNLVLLEVESREPLELRYRLVGTAVCTLYGRDFTGRMLSEMNLHGLHEIVHSAYQRSVDAEEPVFFRGGFALADGRIRQTGRLALPMTGADGEVGYILSAVGVVLVTPRRYQDRV